MQKNVLFIYSSVVTRKKKYGRLIVWVLLSAYYISKSRHQEKSRSSGYKRNQMNNINAGRGERQTHEVVHHGINCQISPDLIAYYVMSVSGQWI